MERSSLIPGFRFHPTDEELVMYYLKRKLLGRKIVVNAIAEVNIYDFSPWDLPDKSSLRNGDLEWFFFCPKSKKYSSGSRSNRATEIGFWKATGKDRKVTYKERTVATIKTLVFHLGHAGNGQRTDWVMHEYKMEDDQLASTGVIQDMYVVCKVFEKSGPGPKNGSQYGAPFNEVEWDDDDVAICSTSQAVVDPKTVDRKQKGPAATNTSVTKTGSLCITEPGSSSLTFSPNETNVDVPHVNDDQMLFDYLVSFFELSPEDLNGNNENTGVEVAKSVPRNEDGDIFDDLADLINLDDLNEENFKTDVAAAPEYTFDEMLATDLSQFYVD